MSVVTRYPFTGMIGYMQHPHTQSYNTAVFLVASEDLSQMNFVITEPGSYDAVMAIAKLPQVRKINIFAQFMDLRMISDIYRICVDIDRMELKKDVSFYYPEYVRSIGERAWQAAFWFTERDTYLDEREGICIEYLLNANDAENVKRHGQFIEGFVYDIQISTPEKVVYIPGVFDPTAPIDIVSRNFSILLPYSKTNNGGFSYRDVIEHVHTCDRNGIGIQCYDWLRFIKCMAFSSPEEMQYFTRNASRFLPGYKCEYYPIFAPSADEGGKIS